MNEQKYGLVEDIDKFVETNGTEGVIEPQAPSDPPPSDPPQEYNVQEQEEYISLQGQYNELETKFNDIKPLNPKFKEIEEWASRTNRPIEDWIKHQEDINGMSDLDVLRATQRQINPNLTSDELDFYINDNFLPKELDSDEDNQRRQIAMKQAVHSGREAMEKDRLVFDTVSEINLTAEQKSNLEYASTSRAEAQLLSDNREAYKKAMTDLLPKSNKISLSLTGEKSIDYNIPSDSSKNQLDYLEKMDRWKNDDGSQNYEAYLGDSYKIRHFDDIISLVYEQGKNDQLESSASDSRNIVDPSKITATPSESKYGLIGKGPKKRYQV